MHISEGQSPSLPWTLGGAVVPSSIGEGPTAVFITAAGLQDTRCCTLHTAGAFQDTGASLSVTPAVWILARRP